MFSSLGSVDLRGFVTKAIMKTSQEAVLQVILIFFYSGYSGFSEF